VGEYPERGSGGVSQITYAPLLHEKGVGDLVYAFEKNDLSQSSAVDAILAPSAGKLLEGDPHWT